MATIYQKTVSDKTCILAPREFILRPFDFGTDWTEMRFGVFFDGVTSTGDNVDVTVTEDVALSTYADRIAFGIKDSASNDLPGFGAALFLGAMTPTAGTSTCEAATPNSFRTYGGSLVAGGLHETTLVGGTGAETLGKNMDFPPISSAVTGYNGVFVLKFVISNRGAASQSVAISRYDTTATPIAGTDYSAAALRILMNNGPYTGSVAVAWNTGAAARVIPDAVYIRMPFYSNRIRISAMRAIRYAP